MASPSSRTCSRRQRPPAAPLVLGVAVALMMALVPGGVKGAVIGIDLGSEYMKVRARNTDPGGSDAFAWRGAS